MRWLTKLLTAITGTAFTICLLVLFVAVVFYRWIALDLPSVDGLRQVRLEQPLRVFSVDGLLIAEFGVKRREPVDYDATPELLVKAFLAAEDSRFFSHPGIDLQALLRAALSLVRTGEIRQGGSTITMQVARNFFLTREKSFRRKLAELILAREIEQKLSKTEILELYQNKIFFGHRAYGVSAAATLYYDKPLEDLSLAQMAMLAGIPQAPSTNNPVSNPKKARARRDYVLKRMHEVGYIDAAQLAAALQEAEKARLHTARIELEAPYVAEMVRSELLRRFGTAAYRDGLRVATTIDSRMQLLAGRAVRQALRDYDERHGYRGAEARVTDPEKRDAAYLDRVLEGLPASNWLTPAVVLRVAPDRAELYLHGGRIITLEHHGVAWARRYRSADRRGAAPKRLSKVIAVGDLVRLRQDEEGGWRLTQLPAVAGALVALAPTDGAIRALVGGLDFSLSKFNRAVDARRQPGSSFKPFVYAAALEKGWTPASLLDDDPIAIRDGSGRVWKPRNFDHKYLGPVRLRTALTQSRNLASINLLQQVGVDFARDFIQRFGFAFDRLPNGLSLVLGSGEVAPLEMAEAYAVFANGGFRIEPFFIQRIENARGSLVFEADPRGACRACWYASATEEAAVFPLAFEQTGAERVLEPGLAFQMDSLLRDVIRVGTGRRAQALERGDLAGKTGTTNDTRDSWFCGYQSELVAVAWMGFDDPRPLGRKETGGRAALSLWMEFMGPALEGKSEASPIEPSGLIHVWVNKRSGSLTDHNDPNGIMETVRQEYELMLLGPGRTGYGDALQDRSQRKTQTLLEELF